MHSSGTGIGEAKGKVILLGEHAVVHGAPALAMSVNRGVRVTASEATGPLTLTVAGRSDPVIAGDGSTEGEALEQLAGKLGIQPGGVSLFAEMHIRRHCKCPKSRSPACRRTPE